MHKTLTRTRFWLFFLLLLGGCATAPKPDESVPELTDSNWQLRGKLAMLLPEQRLSANLNWHHRGEFGEDSFRLTSPLGTTVLSLESTPGHAEILYDDQRHQGTDAEQLIQQLTGWTLPLSQLSQYLLGNVTQAESVQFDNNRDPLQLTLVHPQNGQQWQLNYRGWQSQSGHKVPRQIELRRGQQRIKLVLSHWQPEP